MSIGWAGVSFDLNGTGKTPLAVGVEVTIAIINGFGCFVKGIQFNEREDMKK